MGDVRPQANKALVLEAFDTLFNRRDYATAEQFWSPRYIQHSAHIAPGREGLFNLVRAAPPELRYDHGLILAEGDHVMVHGRFSGHGRPAAWVAVDILRIEDGVLAEHWDVLQDEATKASSISGLPMFGAAFPTELKRRLPMTERVIKVPGPSHPITVTPNPNRVVVRLGDKVLADTTHALTLREASYPAAQYIPRKDVDMAALSQTDTQSYCPYKGDASYFSIPQGGARSVDAVWTYEAPYESVAAIKDHLAFYPDRVGAIEEHAA